jgi:hypothetical protein
MRSVRIADDMADELDAIDGRAPKDPEILPPEPPKGGGPGFDFSAGGGLSGNSDSASPPQKRPRGRPRKYPLPPDRL